MSISMFGRIWIAILPYTGKRSELALSFWTTPAHAHAKKKEDIICRWGKLAVQVWVSKPPLRENTRFGIPINHEEQTVTSGSTIELDAGSRVTLVPGVYHEFYPVSAECIIGEVSTANDDLHDNFFVDPRVGRYPGIEEDVAANLAAYRREVGAVVSA
jgi:D-lyxose ketol-isomerase